MAALFSLFNILAIVYVFRSVQLGITIWREWPQVRQDPLTHHKKRLAEQAAIFLMVPIGVFVHEGAHALATWSTGGQVVEFGYRFFWGYVLSAGQFTPAQSWLIAIAGTIGSLLFGLFVWAVTRNAGPASIRYFGLRTVRFQIYFSLLYYPIFTLLGFDGDWRTIYDFSLTPLLSGITAVAHVAALWGFWRFDRTGRFERPAFESLPAQQRFDDLSRQKALAPQDSDLQLAYIDALRAGSAHNLAKYELKQFLSTNPHSASGHLILALLEMKSQRDVSKPAAQNAQQALELGLSDGSQQALAHEIVARHALEIGDAGSTIEHLSAALALLNQDPVAADAGRLVELYLTRNRAYRRQNNFDEAIDDIRTAYNLAVKADNENLAAKAQKEYEIIKKHSGRPLSTLATEKLS